MESERTMQAHRKKPPTNPEQQTLDFTSALNERLAEIRSLEYVLLEELGPRKVAGVIEMLERVALCSGPDLQTSFARAGVLGAGIRGRRPVAERTIRRWREDTERLGLLEVDKRSHRFGGALTNRWTIRLDRLRELLATRNRADAGRTQGGHDVRPRADNLSDLTVAAQWNGAATKPVPDGPDTDKERASGGFWSADRESGTPRPENVAGAVRGGGTTPPAPIRGDLFAQHPILAAAVGRHIAPLPCRLIDGKAFLSLQLDQLRQCWPLVAWFREQLGLERPLLDGTEAHLLLVLAAAQFALSCPENEVGKSRVALFAYTVGRRLWLRVLHKLPAAREQLDQLLRYLPEAFTHPTTLGPKRSEPLAAEVAAR